MSTEAELARVATTCEPLRHAYLLGQWAGSGRATTAQGWPDPDCRSEIAGLLGVPVPETALDPRAPAVARAWVTACETGLVDIDGAQAASGATLREWHELSPQETLVEWLSSLVAALHTMLDTVDSTAAAQLAHAGIETLRELDTPATEQTVADALEARLQDDYSGLADYLGAEVDLDSVVERYRAGLPAELRAFGAIDDEHTVTAVGEWALGELASWQQEDSETLDELDNMLAAAGVELDDPDAVREWLEGHADEVTAVLGDSTTGYAASDSATDDDEDDLRVIDLKTAFELPDELPPISLSPPEELAAAARATDPELAGTDAATAIAAWQHDFYELLSDNNFLTTEPAATTTTDGESEPDFTAIGAIIAMRLFLDGPASPEEIQEIVNSAATLHLEPSPAAAAWARWVADHGDPAQQLTAGLLATNAAQQHGETIELTELAMSALRDRLEACEVTIPLLSPPANMSTVELVAAVESVSEPETLRLTTAWVATREPAEAARELLSLAGAGTPTQRMIAMAVTQQLDPAPVNQWEAALDVPELRAHAKMALADARDESPDESDEVELDSAELAWLLADSLTAATDRLTTEELAEYLGESVLPTAEEPELFDTIRRSGHPAAHTVLHTIGTHHPDAKTAKAARRAAYKTASDDS